MTQDPTLIEKLRTLLDLVGMVLGIVARPITVAGCVSLALGLVMLLRSNRSSNTEKGVGFALLPSLSLPFLLIVAGLVPWPGRPTGLATVPVALCGIAALAGPLVGIVTWKRARFPLLAGAFLMFPQLYCVSVFLFAALYAVTASASP